MNTSLSKAQEKLIKSLHTKKGRAKNGLCLVEGTKFVEAALDFVQFRFTRDDSERFDVLVTTDTPQDVAAVCRVPEWSVADVLNRDVVVVLDRVQDPGNVGTILRLCAAFDASLVLVESADVSSPKVIRSSAGQMFEVPFLKIRRSDFAAFRQDADRHVYRLERSEGGRNVSTMQTPCLLLAGSEGCGILLDVEGVSISLVHSPSVESLNVGSAIAIVLQHVFNS